MTRSAASDTGTTIIEILGLAGSGKSTTCRQLQNSWADVLPTFRVDRRRLPGALLRRVPRVVSRQGLAALRDPSGSFTGLRLAIHMDAMLRDLSARRGSGKGYLFLDQGPIFNCVSASRLADLGQIQEWVPAVMREQLLEQLDFLDSIVFVDAESRILLSRIDTRSQQHRIKGLDESAMLAFLDDYRLRYDRILEEIRNQRDVPLLQLDTGRHEPNEIIELVRLHVQRAERDAEQDGRDLPPESPN